MFILASASPRRRDLLLQIGADFAAVTSGAEESLEEAVPHEAVVRNALAKARAVAAEYPEHAVLGADTAVVVDGRAFGTISPMRAASSGFSRGGGMRSIRAWRGSIAGARIRM